MIYRDLGGTGEKVSAIGVGGWHLGLKYVDEPTAFRIVRSALDRGINFLDNSWDYNDGASEVRMGKALRDGYREKAFLMTKIDGRSKKEAARQLDESLKRLQVDHVDLVQHHEILRFEDPHRIFDEEGANAALLEAREAGKLRFIGFTGHKDPQIHLHMLAVADSGMLSWKSEVHRRSQGMENKKFDAVQFMRQARDKMSSEMRDMNFEEQRAYIEQHASKVRRELESRHETKAV